MFARHVSRRSAVATLAAAGLGTACRATSVATGAASSVDDVAEGYVRLALQVAQHQPSLIENWLGPASWRPGPRRPISELHAELAAAITLVQDLEPPDQPDERSLYLQQQLAALMVAVRRLAGESMRFLDEARASLGKDAGDAVERIRPQVRGPDTATVEAAVADLQQRLPGGGPLHQRYATFRSRHTLSAARVLPTVQAAVESCRRRVPGHVPLPDAEHVDIEPASGLGAEARALYLGDFRTRVMVDTSGGLDLARLVWLSAHETYPGHHVQHVLADRDLIRAKGWHERALHPSFGRHLLSAEGAAETGAALLLDGPVFEEVCRELAPVAGTDARAVPELVAVYRAVSELDLLVAPIARAYLDGEIGSEAAADQLTEQALVLDGRQFLFAIERQRTRLLAYPVGRRLVSARVFDVPASRRWEQWARITTTLALPS